jgi:hypothetical protein
MPRYGSPFCQLYFVDEHYLLESTASIHVIEED